MNAHGSGDLLGLCLGRSLDVRHPLPDGFDAWIASRASSNFPNSREWDAREARQLDDLGVTEPFQGGSDFTDWRDRCFHGRQSTAFGRSTQPDSVGMFGYRNQMAVPDSKKVLWDNVQTLMKHRFDKVNVNGFAEYVGIGVGSVLRMREGETSVGVDIIDKIARKFGLEPWHLLVPNLIANSPPMLAADSERVKELLANVERSVKAMGAVIHEEGNSEAGGFDDAAHVQPPAISDQQRAKRNSKRESKK